MGRNFIYKILGALIFVVSAVLWILSLTVSETFGFFNLAWAGVILCGGIGILFLLNGVFQKNITTVKKLKIWFGAGLLICAILCLVSAITIPKSLILPIISIVITVAFLITVLATGGKKWDEGENHKAGYKNYYERKAEEEKKEKESE